MRSYLPAIALPLALAACAEPKWAPDADVARYHYATGNQPSITLYTAINNRSGEGGHAALLIDAPSERVIFDPAGTWWNRTAPERNDVIHGITPQMLDYYIDYHARSTYHMVEQKIYVTPEVAEQALREVKNYGAVSKAMCSRSTSDVLDRLPGFESVGRTFFPARLMRRFGEIPGVQTREYYDDDSDDNSDLLNSQLGGVRATEVRITPGPTTVTPGG